ncbi:MAG: hypothetical protein JJ992_12965, partial [Planctomycetes bacterium]|nr:hypothetical protein [Planctomycetota bacterium]
MTDDPSKSELQSGEYSERITPRARAVAVLVIVSLLFPFVWPIFAALLGGVAALAATWALLTMFVAVAFGWHCGTIGRRHELENRQQLILSLTGGGIVIMISTSLAMLLSWWTTSHIHNESGEPIDLVIASDESLFIRKNITPSERISFTDQFWGDQVTLHVGLYYLGSQLNSNTRFETDFSREIDLKIEPKGVITSDIEGRNKRVFPPSTLQTEAERIRDLNQ